MRKTPALLFLIVFFLSGFSHAQDVFRSPFSLLGPVGTPVYSDLKTAYKAGSACYKLHLEGALADTHKIDQKIAAISKLQVLKMESNGCEALPEAFSQLNSLIFFSSRNNPLKSLPRGIENWQTLMYLELNQCKFDSLPSDIAYLSKLKMLNIQQNSSDTFRLPSSIAYLSALKDILLYQVNLD
jgi:Leucine-rich repeat (LRR) protein